MRFDAPAGLPTTHSMRATEPERRSDVDGVVELLLGVFRRDLIGFFPHSQLVRVAEDDGRAPAVAPHRPHFRRVEASDGDVIDLFGARYRIASRDGQPFGPQERRMVDALGTVASLRYQLLFQPAGPPRLDLYRGGSEDHYVSAFVEPAAYRPPIDRPSRIASTIQTLRTAALSTYENHRVSTGALLLGPGDDPHDGHEPTPPDALPYGVELTGLKSIHRLCDGKRTLFRVDAEGRLAGLVDVARFASRVPEAEGPPGVPCARAYQPHARATRAGGHVCLVLSPNQEIKLFAEGVQAFAFAHGRWRILDSASKFAIWQVAVDSLPLARALFQAAVNLAEARHGALFVVVDDPIAATGRLIAPHDLLSGEIPPTAPAELVPSDPLARRALHYLARGRSAVELDPPVLEALASLDGALATDRGGRLLAFGAILRHDAAELPGLTAAEGARTTAALVASRYGPVLKVSEDGVVSCFLDGVRIWDL
jgi:hypothetical protein